MFVNTFLTNMQAESSFGYFQTDEASSNPVMINQVIIGHCTPDKAYIIQSPEIYVDGWTSSFPPTIDDWDGSIPNTWEWETILNADFNGNLAGGSVEFSVEAVSELRLKKRKNGDLVWKTIFVQEVNEAKDFQFDYTDWLTAGNTTYQYAIVPVVGGEETAISSSSILSSFHDYYIFDKDVKYHVIVDSSNSPTFNVEGAAQTTIARKYPFIIQNGYVGYYSGTFEGVFVDFINCEMDLEGGAKYRQEVDKFLSNGKAKVLKDWLGNMYMISIVESFSQDPNDYLYLPKHSINWVECGSAENIGDLYDNGFIDVDIDRE